MYIVMVMMAAYMNPRIPGNFLERMLAIFVTKGVPSFFVILLVCVAITAFLDLWFDVGKPIDKE